MSWYGDPDELDRLAARLVRAADDVRSRAVGIRTWAAAAAWRGRAADAFHASIAREAQVLDRAAGELEDGAAALHRHAGTVRAELARLRELERAAEQLVSAGVSTVEGAVQGLLP